MKIVQDGTISILKLLMARKAKLEKEQQLLLETIHYQHERRKFDLYSTRTSFYTLNAWLGKNKKQMEVCYPQRLPKLFPSPLVTTTNKSKSAWSSSYFIRLTVMWINLRSLLETFHAGITGKNANEKSKGASRQEEEMTLCPYQHVALSINKVINEKWNQGWIRENDKFKRIKPDAKPWKEKFTSRKNKTVINGLRTGHTLLVHRYLMKGLPVPQCELCQNDTMAAKHFIISSNEHRCFVDSIPNIPK